jgi:hypothetical protein
MPDFDDYYNIIRENKASNVASMLIIPKIISRVIASSLVPELYWNLALYLI